MTLPVPNMQAALAAVKGGMAFLVPPWNSFFQQLVQPAPAVVAVTLGSPFTANANGKVIITGAVTIDLTRGQDTVNLNGQRIIPIRIGDVVSWTGPATVQYWGD